MIQRNQVNHNYVVASCFFGGGSAFTFSSVNGYFNGDSAFAFQGTKASILM
jgi:hypothetical protein